MIGTSAVTLDEEAEMYRGTIIRDFITPAQCTQVVEKRNTTPRIVCYRCGMRGHTADHCDGPLPSPTMLEAAIQGDIDSVMRELTSTRQYERDTFGCFLREGVEVQETETWKTSAFCLNCGEHGHTYSKCSHIPGAQLMRELDMASGRGGEDLVFHRFKEMWLS